jgi:hypothetical protein
VTTRLNPVDVTIPVQYFFWSAGRKANDGISLSYENTVYHNDRWFSVNVGINTAHYGDKDDSIELVSLFFTPRFWFFNYKKVAFYFNISAGGLTLLSKDNYKGRFLGSHFTFQDYIGLGMKIGHEKAIEIAFNFYHYSNASLFPPNPGFDVPGVLSISFVM